jgi:hypothetical protein
VVAPASRRTGVPTDVVIVSGARVVSPFTTARGLWLAPAPAAHAMRAAKSCWNAVRQRQIVAWSVVCGWLSMPITVSRELSRPGYESPPCVQNGRGSPEGCRQT